MARASMQVVWDKFLQHVIFHSPENC
jgi:hypothetical protein